jgi:hypothetical protein
MQIYDLIGQTDGGGRCSGNLVGQVGLGALEAWLLVLLGAFAIVFPIDYYGLWLQLLTFDDLGRDESDLVSFDGEGARQWAGRRLGFDDPMFVTKRYISSSALGRKVVMKTTQRSFRESSPQ